MVHRYSRTEKIIGQEGIKLLARSRIAVFGLGGVGSFAVEALARSGVGSFLLVDHDIVDITNINRQLHALTSTIGQSKCKLLASRIKDINPEAIVDTRFEKFDSSNAEELLTGDLSFVVDAIDDVNNKVLLLTKCIRKNIPVVSAMGTGNKLDPTAFQVRDISETSICPLARKVRRELRRNQIYSGITVVYSPETPVKAIETEDANIGSRISPGSISFVPPVAGMILAGLVVKGLLALNNK